MRKIGEAIGAVLGNPSKGGLIGIGLGLALSWFAYAQIAITSNGLLGNEYVEVQSGGAQGPGGTSVFTTTGRMTNGRSYAYFTVFPNASFTIGAAPVAQTTVSTAGITSGGLLVFNVTNGSAITITMPPTAQLIDGEIIGVCNVTAAPWATNAVTVAANTGQSFVGVNIQTLTTLAASACNKWMWNGPAATWFSALPASGAL